jgi:Na+/phosphate symporter
MRNKEQVQATNRKYRKEHAERLKETNKQWQEQNKELVK